MHAKHRNGPRNGYRSNAMGMGGSASQVPPEGTMRGHRTYNSDHRRFNSGGSHSKQFQQSIPRGGGIFVEAGKLAAEYLVSTGVLPPNSLSGKWECDSLKNMGSYRDRPGSIHSRLGNAGLDAGPGRRRNSNDHGLKVPRSSVRERKQTGLLRNCGSEENRELGCSGSRVEKINDVESDASVGRRDEICPQADSEARVASGVVKPKLVEDTGANDGTMSNCDAANGELVGNSDDGIKFNKEAEVVKVGRNDDLEQKCDDLVSEEDRVDLVKHSKFVHVPTRARSLLTGKNKKCDQDPVNGNDENIDRKDLSKGSGVQVVDVEVEKSASGASANQNTELKSQMSDAPTMEPERSNSILTERVEKRAMDFDIDCKDDVKKIRQWAPVPDAPKIHDCKDFDTDCKDISVFSENHANLGEFMEEKQLFQGSFKTCDLNLVENGDVSENCYEVDHMLSFSSIMQDGKRATPIDVDMSVNNNSNLPNDKNSNSVMNVNGIEVIDLEKDSTPEDNRRGDTILSDVDGFANSAHNGNGIPNVQDGYGLMISEILGDENPNEPVDLNPLRNHMDLPNAEVILDDDDPIYMSLGEIPISLLGAWEQPSQDYRKPF